MERWNLPTGLAGSDSVDVTDDDVTGAGYLVGLDFDFGGDPPANWQSFEYLFEADAANLVGEDGIRTSIDVVSDIAGFTAIVPVDATASTIPQHTQSLTNLDGYSYNETGASFTSTFSGLVPGSQYRVYVFAHSFFADTYAQDVTIVGHDTATFTQTLPQRDLVVNGAVGSSTQLLEDYAELVIADAIGEIAITVAPATGSSGIAISGLAVQRIVTSDSSLSVTIGSPSIDENGGVSTATVSRSSGTVGDLTVSLTSSDTTEATVPASVTIPDGSDSVTFDITGVNESTVDGTQSVTVTASAILFQSGEATIEVLDDDFEPVGPLIGIDFQSGDSIPTNWTAFSSFFSVDASNLIAENGTTTMVDITSTFTGSVGGLRSLAPNATSIPMHKQSLATIDSVSTDVTGGAYTARFSDLAPGDEYRVYVFGISDDFVHVYSNDVIITGYNVVSFTQPLDNNDLNVNDAVGSSSQVLADYAKYVFADSSGAIEINVSASAGADGYGVAGFAIQRTGRFTETLTVSIDLLEISENGGQALGTVVRNGGTVGDLVVNLTSDDTSEATVPATVTIPDGSDFANFPIRAVNDTDLDGTQTVTITATAIGISYGTATIDVTDDDVPPFGPMVGIDFIWNLNSPTNWNALGGTTLPASSPNLIDEDGNTTNIYLDISGGSSQVSGYPAAIDPATLPNNVPSLSGLDDQIYSIGTNVNFTWHQLNPLANYEVYVFGLDSDYSLTQSVTITGEGAPIQFNQQFGPTQLAINDSVGSNAAMLYDYAVVAQANSLGDIVIDVTPLTTNFVAFAGLAIREVLAVPTIGADLSVTTQGDETGPVDIVYTVTLSESNATGAAITFDLDDLGTGSATSGLDYSVIPANAQISVAAGASSGSYVVSVSDDSLVEGDESINLAISNPSAASITIGVASATATIADNDFLLDFGDAPSPYPTQSTNNGARHNVTGPTLGLLRDDETDGTPSAGADGDDVGGVDDEDGIVMNAVVFASASGTSIGSIDVNLQNAGPISNRLDGWIDFNRDGDWDDLGEQIFTSFDLGTTNGVQTINYTIPADAGANIVGGNSYARFRLSTAGGLAFDGPAADGEVEDYPVTVVTADPIVVDTLVDESDGDYSPLDLSLREAIELANAHVGADTIVFAAGLIGGKITLSSGQLVISDDLSLNGPGAVELSISGNDASRVFDIQTGAKVTLDSLTITNGATSAGANPGYGGAIRSFGTLQIIRSVVTDSRTDGFIADGGAIFQQGGRLSVIDSIVSSNSTAQNGSVGGAVRTANASVLIERSLFDSNSNSHPSNSGTIGGALFASGGTVSIVDSTFSNNLNVGSDSAGGAIGVVDAVLNMSRSTIANNSTTGPGGGIYMEVPAGPDATIVNSTISGNVSSNGNGGGIFVYRGRLHLLHDTITSNSAPDQFGSGLASFSNGASAVAFTTIKSSIVSGNINSDIDNLTTGSGTASIFSSGFNLIGIGNASVAFNQASDQTGVTDPGLGALANNGGLTETHALLPGSPAINAGGSSSAESFDQRGTGFARIVGGIADVGAFEIQPTDPSVTIAVDFTNIPEAAGVATFTATLSEISGDDVTVDLGFSGAATLSNDYTVNATSIVIPAGSLTGSVAVTAVQDVLDDDAETIVVDILSVAGGTEDGVQQQTTTIDDDDLSTISVAVDSTTIGEDDAGVLTFTFTRDIASASAPELVVEFALSGSATAWADYASPGAINVTFAPGASTTVLLVAPNADSVAEPDESVTVTVLDGEGYLLGTNHSATATIVNDDLGGTTPMVLGVVYFNEDADSERNFSPDQTGQRSIIRHARVTFSGPVAIPLGPVTDDSFVIESNGGQFNGMRVGLEVISSEVVLGQQVVVLKFTGRDLIERPSRRNSSTEPMLIDGDYRFTIDGALLGIDANGVDFGVNATDEFFRLFGDTDGDGDVDGIDHDRFVEYYETGHRRSQFDFDARPSNTSTDEAEFIKRLG
ncbi:MAG: hypothetical protein KDB00_25480 [Planctomycetales bacterium]|nr:hypothetical protein [Planctomycetales bacterium]